MPYGTVIQQGTFTSDGNSKRIAIRSDVDWMEVINRTQWATTQSTGRGIKFEWQRGLAAAQGFEIKKADGSVNTLEGVFLTSGGFTLLDTSDATPEAQKTGTTITKAAPAVATITSHGFSTGDIVRIYSSDNMAQINGLEFTITVTGSNTFTLANLNTNTANFTASTSFLARRIPFDPIYYPRNRVITRISAATQAIVTMAVTHNLTVGQLVSFRVPSDFGMIEMDRLTGKIVAIGAADVDGFTNTITVDVDTSAFTAFAWPAATAAPLSFAQVIPFGDDALVLDGATTNVSIIGMQLDAGINSPAGSNGDVIFWRAGKSERIVVE